MVLERELHGLKAPCTISDLMKRCGASRMPIEKHLKSMMAQDEFEDIGIVRIGGYDIVYRRCLCPDCNPSPPVASQMGTATTTDKPKEE